MTEQEALEQVKALAQKERSDRIFAAKCGISQPYFSQILNGKRPMTNKLLEAVGLERRTVTSYHRKAKVPA